MATTRKKPAARKPSRNGRPSTLGALRESGYAVTSVRDELRNNLMKRLRNGEPVFPGIVGYEDTVIPQVENAILAGAGHHPARRTRTGEVPHDPRARGAARRRDTHREGQRGERRPARPHLALRHRAHRGRRATTPPSSGSDATGATERSSRRPTSRSPTSWGTSTRYASRRAATSRTSSPSTTASSRAPTGASSASTSCRTSRSVSRWDSST